MNAYHYRTRKDVGLDGRQNAKYRDLSSPIQQQVSQNSDSFNSNGVWLILHTIFFRYFIGPLVDERTLKVSQGHSVVRR